MKHYYFEKFGNYGRLGNQIMEWLAMMGIAEANGGKFYAPKGWKYASFFTSPPEEQQSPATSHITEKHYHFDSSLMAGLADHTSITGWLQSPKYYKDHHLKRIQFTGELIEEVKRKVPALLTGEAIAISVRRGDFVKNKRYAQIPAEYYGSALVTHFDPYRPVIIFSDDFEYCKVHFQCIPNVTFAEGLSDIEQLCAMTLCEDFIISNSTFSYVGALLADRGTVVRPRWIFSESYRQQNSERDYWPDNDNWIIHDACKLDLTDTTFTIPVMFDHPDRKQNLDLSLCLLQRHFNTHTIIGEQGTDKFGYTNQWAKYMKFDMAYFHRTKMLNDMARMATTPYVYNWDCDNIVPMLQVWYSVDALRRGADMVYPFDGRVARMNRVEWFKKMEKDLDVGITAGTYWHGRWGQQPILSSVGHGVVVNKERFFESGGENEYFISYGPEDCERWDRWNKLGFRVERIKGVMYHMDHYCGPDSGVKNPYFHANKAELIKERAMSVEEMWDYVKAFPWCHTYTEDYYSKIVPGAQQSATEVYKILEGWGLPIEKIIDIGAGVGEWEHGLNYTGIDHKSPNPKILEHDLRTPYKSQQYYDIALCLEVAEHLPAECAGTLVESLCSLAPMVLFSAAIPFQGGESHINEQWQDWWANLFARFNYRPYLLDIREPLWNNDRVEVWYKQNMVLYWKGEPGKYELRKVHPQMWMNHKYHLRTA